MRTPRIPCYLCCIVLAAVAGCGPEVPSGLGTATQAPAPPPAETATPSAGADSGAPSTPSAPTNDGVDTATVLASIAQGRYRTSSSFTEVTQAPYPSVASPGSMILEWVSTSSAPAYEAISPGLSGSGVVTPAGTTVVRAILDADGGVDKLTLMFKGPPGYNPALGDWWFGVTDPDGSPLEIDGGVGTGKLEGCFSCHVPRSNDDYLFGVPLDDRVSGSTEEDAGTPASDDAGTDANDSGDDDAGAPDAAHRHR